MTTQPSEQPANWKIPFFTIWSGQAVSLFGSNLVQFAIIWYMTKTTGSATVLTLASLISTLPQVLLSPVVGALVDRWNRRKVMMVADSLVALATLVLAALFATDVVQIWHIYLISFIRSLVGVFHWASMTASTTLMVPEKQYARVAGMNQTLFGVINIASPPLGALLLESLPMQGILLIDVGTAMLAVSALFFVSVPQPEPAPGAAEGKPTVLQDLYEGFRFMASRTGLLIVISLATAINLLISPAFTLLPLMVTKHFLSGAMQLAWLEMALGIGAIAGGLILSLWSGFKRRILTYYLAVLLMGVSLVVFGLTPSQALWLGIGALFLTGVSTSVINALITAICQAIVPPGMQGRILTLLISGSFAATPIGLLIAGPVSDRIGAQFWFVLGGALACAMAIIAPSIPAVLHIEDKPIEDDIPPQSVQSLNALKEEIL